MFRSSRGSATLRRAKSLAAELTPQQAQELRKQWSNGRKLTPQQALRAAGISRSELDSAPARRTAGVLPDEGSATSKLNCSEMTLWGDSDGHWVWDNHFWPRKVGPATYGLGKITTDGTLSTAGYFDYDGLDPLESGQLFSAGAWPNYTRVSTWSVNENPAGKSTLCLGFLTAWYE